MRRGDAQKRALARRGKSPAAAHAFQPAIFSPPCGRRAGSQEPADAAAATYDASTYMPRRVSASAALSLARAEYRHVAHTHFTMARHDCQRINRLNVTRRRKDVDDAPRHATPPRVTRRHGKGQPRAADARPLVTSEDDSFRRSYSHRRYWSASDTFDIARSGRCRCRADIGWRGLCAMRPSAQLSLRPAFAAAGDMQPARNDIASREGRLPASTRVAHCARGRPSICQRRRRPRR